MYLSQS